MSIRACFTVIFLILSNALADSRPKYSSASVSIQDGVRILRIEGEAANSLYDSLIMEPTVQVGQYYRTDTKSGEDVTCVDDVTVGFTCHMRFDDMGVSVPKLGECIRMQDAMKRSQWKPASSSELPGLPFGWHWIRVYEISYEEPQPWYWQSWPDETQLKVCK